MADRVKKMKRGSLIIMVAYRRSSFCIEVRHVGNEKEQDDTQIQQHAVRFFDSLDVVGKHFYQFGNEKRIARGEVGVGTFFQVNDGGVAIPLVERLSQ